MLAMTNAKLIVPKTYISAKDHEPPLKDHERWWQTTNSRAINEYTSNGEKRSLGMHD